MWQPSRACDPDALLSDSQQRRKREGRPLPRHRANAPLTTWSSAKKSMTPFAWNCSHGLSGALRGASAPAIGQVSALDSSAARTWSAASSGSNGCNDAVVLGEEIAGYDDRDLPADHVVKNGSRFGRVIRAAVALVVSGPKIERCRGLRRRGLRSDMVTSSRDALSTWRWLGEFEGCQGRRVKRFTEKPDPERSASTELSSLSTA